MVLRTEMASAPFDVAEYLDGIERMVHISSAHCERSSSNRTNKHAVELAPQS
jgi:hypothetical protein